jgi:glycine oxidase
MVAADSEPVWILGGGLIGLAMAHGLARRGAEVIVLSRRRPEAAGFVAAGMLAPHAEGLKGSLLELGRLSLARIPAWVAAIEADAGLPCGLHPCGIVVPFASAQERDAFPTAAFGERLDRAGLQQEVPLLGPGWQAGLLFPQDGQIDNRRRLMRALERACRARGVRFEEGSEVLELISEPPPAPCGRPRLRALRLHRADGNVGTEPCQRAVLACGAWSARLLPGLPVFPVKGQMLSLQGPRGALSRVVFGPGTYLVPREDGLLVVGATSEPEAGFGEGLTPAGQRQLQQGLSDLVPSATHWPPMERWWGFRPCTPDQAPLLGEGPLEGLHLATGHHRNGVLLAAITVEWLAEQILDPARGECHPLLGCFGWNRFNQAKPSAASGACEGERGTILSTQDSPLG